MSKISFASDYLQGTHPEILSRLVATNLEKTPGYGTDDYCAGARDKIRQACRCEGAAVSFLVGGTQTNATVIDALLRPYQGVLSADSGHVGSHEAGAIEAGGHKVLTIPGKDGKITAEQIGRYCADFFGDDNYEHMVIPGMVYLSQPTEFGTLYTLAELEAIRAVCTQYSLPLYIDGARLAYALAVPGNDVTLPDLARLCDVFYIGGTKCGTLFGEAVVIPNPSLMPHFFTLTKQHGALLAKGRLLGLQFDTLFTDDLYGRIGACAIAAAEEIREDLLAKGYRLLFGSPSNQIFVLLDNQKLAALSEKLDYSFWEKYDETHTVIRLATSWATTPEDVQAIKEIL